MFSNLSLAANVSSSLLSQFGKNTTILLEVHGHTIRVRRAHDNALISLLYVGQYDDGVFITMSSSNRHWTLEDVELGNLSRQIASEPRFPQIVNRYDRQWSRAIYRETNEAY